MIEAYMNATLDVLRLAGQMFLRRMDDQLRWFAEDLHDFIYDLDRHPRRDWRERFDAFLADQTARGRELTPESRRELIIYLEMWERNVYGGPPREKPREPSLFISAWDTLTNATSIAKDAVELYPEYFGTQLRTAGNRVVETGDAIGTFVGDHASQAYFDPLAELERIHDGLVGTVEGTANLILFVYSDPAGAAADLGLATVDYVDHLTSDPKVSGDLLGDFTVTWATGGVTGYSRQFAGQSIAALNRLARLPTLGKLPKTLEPLRERIDYFAYRAQKAAFDRGLSGTAAGLYADRYFRRAIQQLSQRLDEAGVDFEVIWEYGRNARGVDLLPYHRPKGSMFLDAALTSRNRSRVFSGWDTRFQSTPYPRWNTAAENAAYVRRFQIEEGFVREISVEGRKP